MEDFIYHFFILLNIASINIAVKNRLSDGINTGYQSFWNKLYKFEFPLTLNAYPTARTIDPIINIYRLYINMLSIIIFHLPSLVFLIY